MTYRLRRDARGVYARLVGTKIVRIRESRGNFTRASRIRTWNKVGTAARDLILVIRALLAVAVADIDLCISVL